MRIAALIFAVALALPAAASANTIAQASPKPSTAIYLTDKPCQEPGYMAMKDAGQESRSAASIGWASCAW